MRVITKRATYIPDVDTLVEAVVSEVNLQFMSTSEVDVRALAKVIRMHSRLVQSRYTMFDYTSMTARDLDGYRDYIDSRLVHELADDVVKHLKITTTETEETR